MQTIIFFIVATIPSLTNSDDVEALGERSKVGSCDKLHQSEMNNSVT
jgi:hypothetical protein